MRIFYENLKTKDNFNISVLRLCPKTNPTSLTIMCHGITGKKTGGENGTPYLFELAKKIVKNNSEVILFDFRGHGQSSGESLDVCPSANIKDLDAIYNNYSKKGMPVNFFGFSYGSCVISCFLFKNNIKAHKIVFWGAGINFVDGLIENKSSGLGKTIFDCLKSGELESDGFVQLSSGFKLNKKFVEEIYNINSDEVAKKIANKTLIIQGLQDTTVDPEVNKTLAEKFKIKYQEIDAGHNFNKSEKLNDAFTYTINHLFN